MQLNEKYLPTFHFNERHALNIAASQADVMAAALDYRPESDLIFRCAIAARELPMRMLDLLKRGRGTSQPAFGMDNFTLLEQRGDQELAFGLAGKFWKPDYGQAPVMDAADFLAFCEPGAAKLVLSFAAEKLDESHTRLRTETRVFCMDDEAQRKFAPYWYLIRPVSGLLRRRMLVSIRQSVANGARPITPT